MRSPSTVATWALTARCPICSASGIISYGPGADEDTIMEAALEAGADDVTTNDDGSIDVYTNPDDFSMCWRRCGRRAVKPDHAEVTFGPNNSPLDRDGAEKLLRLVDFLETSMTCGGLYQCGYRARRHGSTEG